MNNTIIISGTSKGIGKYLAEYYCGKNCMVFGFSRGESKIINDNYYHEQIDICNENDVISYVRKVKRIAGKIDVLICNAAIAPANILGISTNSTIIKDCVDINYIGAFNLIREVSKVMLQKKYGRVLCFSSMAEGLHDKGASLYAGTKAALIETTKVFAKEMAQYNITYNVVAPSVVETSMSDSLGEDIVKNALERLDIKRPLEMSEISYACDFFIKPEASFITGQTLYLGLVC